MSESKTTLIARAITCDEQLAEWVEGRSIHNTARDECCPDFSCCNPAGLAPKSARIAFSEHFRAHREPRWDLLSHFLSGAISSAAPEVNVHVAGDRNEH